ncbi:MAG: sodium/hydrogen antiporter [Chloroflexota bacterium]|jgi:NhaP-type Na+/H+ or K+/H+ antiporter|nr:sodium/hydrogen antiporter [Chloroflexota bacterium]
MPDLLTAFALMAVVLSLSALASGLVERIPISFPMIFLGLGFVLGERGLGLLRLTPHDPSLEVVAILSLAFVLFLDAVRLRSDEPGRSWLVPALSLGPGTLITMALVALAATFMLGVAPLQALLLGAVLSSMDPVVLRDVLRDERIPQSIRQALGVEAGTNDIVVLPAVLVLATVDGARAASVGDWLGLLARLLIMGPVVGIVVGLVSVWLMRLARAHTEISREYRALYGVGAILAAYVVGEAVGSSGFLAVFAAGAVVAALDFDVCDCFLDYGEVTSEMTMLLAFILFGAALSTLIGTVPILPTVLFGVLAIGVARPVAINLVLFRARISRPARWFIGWFGPRGLSSLLFALLLVSRGVAGAEGLLAVVGIVVIMSVLAHGLSAAPLASWYARSVVTRTLDEEREATAAGLFKGAAGDAPRISPQELADRLAGPAPPVVLDVRTRSEYARDRAQIPGSVRVLPDRLTEWAAGQSRDRPVVAYCT